MHFFAPLLFPLAWLWQMITAIRARMYASGLQRRIQFDIPTVVVGNLQAGGSGKTPMIEYLIRQYSLHRPVAVISRGYGRKTRGFILAGEQSTPDQIGDEPFQMFHKFGEKVPFAVGEERILAIPSLLAERPETELIFLDDAFQHLPLQAKTYILLSEFSRPFFKDYPFPVGYLREGRGAAKRADLLIFTKCPEYLGELEQADFCKKAQAYLRPGTWIGFTCIEYHWTLEEVDTYWLVSGLANPAYFSEAAKAKVNVIGESHFSDHHDYNEQDVLGIINQVKSKSNGKSTAILTTEKDYHKLNKPEFKHLWAENQIARVESRCRFLNSGMEKEFLEKLNSLVEAKSA
jgi:tetraacyldisaccharide 4'-kinase